MISAINNRYAQSFRATIICTVKDLPVDEHIQVAKELTECGEFRYVMIKNHYYMATGLDAQNAKAVESYLLAKGLNYFKSERDLTLAQINLFIHNQRLN